VNGLEGTTGIVAVAAAAVAVIALLLCIALFVQIRRLRRAQRRVLGNEERDLVEHAAQLDREYEGLVAYVEDAATKLNRRMESAETRLDATLAHHALVRYDAYGEHSGRQSHSLALLDADRNGVVVTAIAHRDQARMYAKAIDGGEPEIELSPEESEAVQQAMARHSAAARDG
jgi:uncharacterized protein DUF4446